MGGERDDSAVNRILTKLIGVVDIFIDSYNEKICVILVSEYAFAYLFHPKQGIFLCHRNCILSIIYYAHKCLLGKQLYREQETAISRRNWPTKKWVFEGVERVI